MNAEQQRIAIAEACGFVWQDSNETAFGASYPLKAWHHPQGHRVPMLPNYPEDLNAMHEAEKALHDTLKDDQWSAYCTHLNQISCRLRCGNSHLCGYTVSATATQRAEAFLRTLNLWKE